MSSAANGSDAGTAPPATAPAGPKSFVRRDKMLSIERAVQEKWAAQHTFETDAPVTLASSGGAAPAKFMCTFPYPYMNGRLHLGHAFTITKAEFAAGYQSLRGKQVLFPFAFHCTGMPIQAAANRLVREIDVMEGKASAADAADAAAMEEDVEPAMEPASPEPSPVVLAPTTADAPVAVKELGKFSGKKSKAVAKSVRPRSSLWMYSRLRALWKGR